ncbi:MAG TPA: ABC transporter permease [Terracidiphilus sp.]|nr:ABC transporter permease [Terracidiphilus sp.]
MGAFRRLANLVRRAQVNREIEDEIQAHIALREEANRAAGMSAEEAHRNAVLHFGNPASMRERVTAADSALGLDELWRDARYAFRRLRRAPGFAFTAMVTLALGVGANVVVFGVLNAALLKPLGVPNGERFREIVNAYPGDDSQSYPDYVDYRDRNSVFTQLAAYRISLSGLSTGGNAQKEWDYEVSGNYFDALGVQPQLGRFFHTSDEHGPNSAPYIVLSNSFWHARFRADPGVIGRTVDIDKHPFTILGVAPPSFHGIELFFWPDYWVPLVNAQQLDGYSNLDKRGNHNLYLIGALKPGITPTQAVENLNAVAHQLTREHPKEDDGLTARLVRPGLLGDVLGGPVRPFMAAIMLLALLVLAAACVNLAGIFAARAADRSRELAIRLCIGSTRGRILRQLLMETLLVAIAGGIAGTALAAFLMRFLSHWQPIAEFPIHLLVVPDARVYAIALVLTLLSGFLPGLLPARQVWQTGATQALKGGPEHTGLLRRFTLRDLLLGVQITLCALLVTASLVAVRGMMRTLHAPFGFQPRGAMVAELDLQMAGYADKQSPALLRRMMDAVRQIPGVQAVGSINNVPLGGMDDNSDVFRDGTTDRRSSNSVTTATEYAISPEYLGAAGTHLLAGRNFTWDDNASTPPLAIINATFARRMFGAAPAVGRHFMGGDGTRYQVVGVVQDGKYNSLTEEPKAAMYFPLAQDPEAMANLVIRTSLPQQTLEPALRSTIAGIDPTLPVGLQTWPDALALVLFPARVASIALGVMGCLAVLLAVTGIFGMASYTVSRRLRELGIRAALGAHRRQLMRAALGRPVVLLAGGSAAGLLLGVAASRLLAYLVYQASPRDPLVLVGVVLAMALVGLASTWIPARRALAVNPAQLLRED